jgi:hypothetical protein
MLTLMGVAHDVGVLCGHAVKTHKTNTKSKQVAGINHQISCSQNAGTNLAQCEHNDVTGNRIFTSDVTRRRMRF